MVRLKSESEVALLAESNRLVAEVMAEIGPDVVPGAIPKEIDRNVEKSIRRRGAVPAFKGYRGFPASICFSINEEVVHGIPNGTPLKLGDVCSIDIGVKLGEFYGDMARSFPVGKVSSSAKKLIAATQESLDLGIEEFREGKRLFDISAAIQRRAEKNGYGIVRDFVGHGIGRSLHEEPQLPNFGKAGTGPRLRVGMALAIEPMFNLGTHEVEVLDDNWTVVTKDRRLSVHIEDTVVLTQEGPRILTRIEN